MTNFLKLIFWSLTGVFLFILGEFFVPAIRELFRGSVLFLAPFAIFFLLGLVLLVLTIKEKVAGKLGKFLVLTGSSAVGFFTFIILHNLVYGIFIFFFGEDFWINIGIGDEPLFFILAIIVCPIGFLVGAIGSIILLIKNKRIY